MRLFVDQLTNLDFSYLDAKRGLVGETWLANIELRGELDEQGMVCDFGHVKKMIRNWLDEHIDHKLLIPKQSSCYSSRHAEQIDNIEWNCAKGLIKTTAPEQAHCIIDSESINPESVAKWCIAKLSPLFPKSVTELILHFSTEHIDGPFYHYSHGLKKHGGNCQRIAHGHRSKIDIWQDQSLAPELMQNWANTWADIYIGTAEDCQDDPSIAGNYLFQYNAQQGEFSLSIPKSHCYIMHTETTVELIAQHLADTIGTNQPNSEPITVKAYEGIAKGAIAETT